VSNEANPLNDPRNWTQEKVWIVPVEIRIKVDDASKYDVEMQTTVNNVLNELRSVCGNFDSGRKLLTVSFKDPIKDTSKFYEIAESLKSNETVKKLNIQELIAQEVAKALGKK
jgi:hypothetical protein